MSHLREMTGRLAATAYALIVCAAAGWFIVECVTWVATHVSIGWTP